MIKVSIIVPVYGVERYLSRCIDSLLNQTLQEIEIILINDASPDRCPEIMQNYELSNPDKIRCIYLKDNVMQGGARNKGLTIARGEYVLFVDSDDWVDLKMCEKLYHTAKESESDIVFCDFLKVNELTTEIMYYKEIGREISGALTSEKKKLLFSMNAYPFSKLVRRDMIEANNLRFPEKIKYEDQAVVPFFFLYAKRAEKLEEALYYYNVRDNSTMHALNDKHHFDRMQASLLFYQRSKERGFYTEFMEEIDFFFIRSYCYMMLECCLEKFSDPPFAIMEEIKRTVPVLCPVYQSNYYRNKIIDPKYIHMATLNEISPETLIKEWKKGFRYETDYTLFYNETHHKAAELFDYCRQRGYNIALWGAGKKGNTFLEINDYNGRNVQFVIDKDPNKIGTKLKTNHTVVKFEACLKNIQVVIVSNRYHYGETYRTVMEQEEGIYVINLDHLLTYQLSVKDYFS